MPTHLKDHLGDRTLSTPLTHLHDSHSATLASWRSTRLKHTHDSAIAGTRLLVASELLTGKAGRPGDELVL